MTAAILAPTIDRDPERDVRIFAQRIRGKYDALAFILFGSRARGSSARIFQAPLKTIESRSVQQYGQQQIAC